jgi:hypothetical protein
MWYDMTCRKILLKVHEIRMNAVTGLSHNWPFRSFGELLSKDRSPKGYFIRNCPSSFDEDDLPPASTTRRKVVRKG